MFNIGFGEIILIIVIFIITTEPSKFKEYVALIRFCYFKFHALKKEILEQIGFLEKPEKYILGDDGEQYESYDISTIIDDLNSSITNKKAPPNKTHDKKNEQINDI